MADIFTAIITGTTIRVEMTTYAGTTSVVFAEDRPATLADADQALAAHGFGRVQNWDLGPNGDVRAQVRTIDNEFGGTRAARLWSLVGTTHEDLDTEVVGIRNGVPTVQVGDLITDLEESNLYVVAGARFEGGVARIHMVREGGTWESRFTGEFPFGQVVKVARRKA